ncbi:MAG: NADH-quinone oxidoreductase subunit N [Cyclobacteriaceae bacterium]
MGSLGLSEKLHEVLGSISYLLPELCLISGAIFLLILELFAKEKWQLKTILSGAFVLLTAISLVSFTEPMLIFDQALQVDGLSFIFEAVFLFTLLFVLIYPSQKFEIRKLGEYHFLLFTLVLGAFLMVKSRNLLVFYLALELVSISSYILTSLGFRKKGFEAGIKYLLFGALASGVMLYGISLLYGLSGSLDLAVILAGDLSSDLALLALFLMSVGVLFKLSLVPMHIWTPDVYEAAPTSVVAIFSVIPKLAGLVFLARSISFIENESTQLLFIQVISWLAIASMFLGNLAAIWQKNAKRMMAYSSIAHAGFLVIGAVVNNQFAMQSVVFYAIVYAIMNLGTFYFVACMEKNDLSDISDYKGLGKSIPIIGFSLVVIMISLTGLPPTGGFSAKFLLFTSLWTSYETTQQGFMLWLFIFGLVNTLIALFYYLKIPYISIFKTRDEELNLSLSLKDKTVLLLVSILILAIFFKADLLFDLTNRFNFVFSQRL